MDCSSRGSPVMAGSMPLAPSVRGTGTEVTSAEREETRRTPWARDSRRERGAEPVPAQDPGREHWNWCCCWCWCQGIRPSCTAPAQVENV
ncbi:hypothetical protein FM103_09615 [Corynebacterium xerosis]|nr:hypothetical protein FM103_09615 [Corynebacterium xerosis]